MKKNAKILTIALFFSAILWASVSLSSDYFTNYTIPVRIIDFPEGYISGTTHPQNVSIRLRGNGWKLIAVNLGSNPEYIVSAGGDSGRKTVNLYNFLHENQWLTSDIEVIDIYPDTMTFYVEKITSKSIKIEPSFNLDFKPGYGLASSVNVLPESTIVYGPQSLVRTLNVIRTEEIMVNNLDSKTEKRVSLQEYPGMTYENDVVSVMLDVQRIVDKNFEELHVDVIDIPGDRDVVLIPNKVNIGIRGGIDILGRISHEDIRVFVNYRDVVLDTLGGISPIVRLPENTQLLFVKPENLRYVIKKFN
jgi:hypothetical protein